MTTFNEFFVEVFGQRPFTWQRTFAEGEWPEVLIAPTGSGKTAGVTLAWAFHRLRKPDLTPSRLVWCLPMRTLVDQVHNEIRKWLQRFEAAGIDSRGLLPRGDNVHVLMGGIDSGRWLDFPELPGIIVGTQDMLLSRALMRGYASSRAIWPMEFGMLHHDTQWVFDEVQLMGAGRATSAQLEAFRHRESLKATEENRLAGRPCRSLWVSATLVPEWLETVDHPTPTKVFRVNPAAESDNGLRKLTEAPKHLHRDGNVPGSGTVRDQGAYVVGLAASVLEAHQPGQMTLVIVNQVKRAQDLYAQVQRTLSTEGVNRPALVLLHSRFRPADREREMEKLTSTAAASGRIVIATQAIEAGVDISAGVMFTELAPWASMVQRFGRANRRAEVEGGAQVYWIDLLGSKSEEDKSSERLASALSLPYEADELRQARDILRKQKDAAPVHLPPPGEIDAPLSVIRRNDLYDLFDTDADLTGFDVDISPYVRDADDTDIRVYWRDLSISNATPPAPIARELCAVPIGQARTWIKSAKNALGPLFFVRDPQWRNRAARAGSTLPGWVPLRDPPWPGLTVLADIRAGGYHETLGFTGNREHVPTPVITSEQAPNPDKSGWTPGGSARESEGYDDDSRSAAGYPVLLTDHLRHVADEVSHLCETLGVEESTREVLTRAARWHDLGKAHEVFQATMHKGLDGHSVSDGILLAKTVKTNLRHERAYFRHELASALAFLAREEWSRDADLCAFLIASHHGKVRMNLRALPRESASPVPGNARFARGIREGDALPALDLGGTECWPGGSLTLSVMELGLDETSGESWTERTRDLLTRYGPFPFGLAGNPASNRGLASFIQGSLGGATMTPKRLTLHGCSPTPLASYLKALGVLRLLSSRTNSDVGEPPDPHVRGWWEDEKFHLWTTLGSCEFIRYFLHDYAPSPVLAPWNGGSGFYRKDNKDGFQPLASKSVAERFRLFSDSIQCGLEAIKFLDLDARPEGANKARLVAMLRGRLPAPALPWLDAALVLSGANLRFPPLLGTGGNDGRLDFTNNFMRRLASDAKPPGLFSASSGAPSPASKGFLENALFALAIHDLTGVAVGQFSPGTAGGPNTTSGYDGDPTVNPWDYVFMLEGATAFASAATRRHQSNATLRASFPFTVGASAAGWGGVESSDESDARAEFWAPLWRRPACFVEVQALFCEGRAVSNGRTVSDGLDFARALATLGVSRGFSEFQRFGFFKRAGKNQLRGSVVAAAAPFYRPEPS